MENQKFFVLILLKQSRQKDGKAKLFIRITVDGKRAEIATTHFIQPSHWDNSKGRMKSSSPQAVYINGFIDHASNSIQKHFLTNVAVGNVITAPMLKDLYLVIKEKTTPKSLLDAFEYHHIKMTDLIKAGKVAKTTLAKYNYCRCKVESFLKHRYKVKNKQLQDLSLKFVTEFEHFLLVNEGM